MNSRYVENSPCRADRLGKQARPGTTSDRLIAVSSALIERYSPDDRCRTSKRRHATTVHAGLGLLEWRMGKRIVRGLPVSLERPLSWTDFIALQPIKNALERTSLPRFAASNARASAGCGKRRTIPCSSTGGPVRKGRKSWHERSLTPCVPMVNRCRRCSSASPPFRTSRISPAGTANGT